MGKLFGKKDQDGDEDSKRSALFGGRSKKDKSQTQTPYANVPHQSDAYNQAKARAGVPGYAQHASSSSPTPGQSGQNNGYPDEKKATGYGAEKYGASAGYGGDRYGARDNVGGSKYGAGGYGG